MSEYFGWALTPSVLLFRILFTDPLLICSPNFMYPRPSHQICKLFMDAPLEYKSEMIDSFFLGPSTTFLRWSTFQKKKEIGMRFAVNETIRIPSKTKAKNEQSLAKSEIKSISGAVNNIALSKKLLIPGEEGISFEKSK